MNADERGEKQMNNGELTAKVARALTEKFRTRVVILFDHGDKAIDGADKVGTIRSWFGDARNRDTLLADLDIAVVLPNSDRVSVLIEVEESSANPKTILGDVFATLLGEHITFQGERELEVDSRTVFAVMVQNGNYDRLTILNRKIQRYHSAIPDGNARLGLVALDAFANEFELEAIVTGLIKRALDNQRL